MKKIAFIALAGSIALAACSQTEEAPAPAETGDTTIINEAPEVPPMMVDGETATDGSSLTIDGGNVDATVSEDGVQADIQVDE